MLVSFSDYGKKPPLFEDATAVANSILESGFEFDTGILFYNRFKTVVSYETSEIPLHTLDAVLNASKIHTYDSLDAEVCAPCNVFFSNVYARNLNIEEHFPDGAD